MKLLKIVISLGFYLVLVVFELQAQTLPNGWQVEAVHGPSQVGIVETIAVDLNQDGLMDVVSASIDDGHVRAYINQGHLQFEQQIISTDVMGAYRLIATDLNADGETDFLLPSIESHEIIALIADNQEQPHGYRKLIIAGDIQIPTDAQTGDFNGDGLMDVVSTSFADNRLLLHLQNSQGDFSTEMITNTPQQPRKIVVADFNDDQIPDILLASSGDNSVRLFGNSGHANFKEILISDQLTGIRSIAGCANPADKLPNFVAAATDDNQIVLFTNNGQDNFTRTVVDNDLPGADGLRCVDIDGDGTLELISISRLYDNIYSQALTEPFNKQVVSGRRDGYITATLFVNQGNPYILTQSYFENRNLLYTHEKPPKENVIWEDFPDGAMYLEAGDIDNDGNQDMVYPAFRADKVYWAEQTGTGYQKHIIFDNVDGPQSIKIFDIDEDGDLDVFSAGAWDDRFYFHQNQGQGEFKTFIVSDRANNPARIDVMDVNGDSKSDLVTTSSLDDSLRWFDVNGVQFTENLIDDQLDGALALRIDDIDQDGDDDILVGSYFGNSITAFYNQGLGQFNKQLLSANKTKPTVIQSGDVDNDGDTDIVFNASNDQSVWLLENSNHQFQEQLVFQGDDIIKSLTTADVNIDGYADVVSVSDQTGTIHVSQNSQAVGFNTSVLTELPFGISYIVTLADHNSGFSQFALASNRNNSIQILSQKDVIFRSGFE